MKRKIAILLLEENAIMINSLLTKQEQKKFNGDFVSYLVRIIKSLDKEN